MSFLEVAEDPDGLLIADAGLLSEATSVELMAFGRGRQHGDRQAVRRAEQQLAPAP
jgi:hypothetical protein